MEKIIKVKVIAKSKKEKIEKRDDLWRIYVNEAPEKDKANRAAISFLAKFFNIPKSNISIIAGRTSSYKLIKMTTKLPLS